MERAYCDLAMVASLGAINFDLITRGKKPVSYKPIRELSKFLREEVFLEELPIPGYFRVLNRTLKDLGIEVKSVADVKEKIFGFADELSQYEHNPNVKKAEELRDFCSYLALQFSIIPARYGDRRFLAA